MILAVTAFRLAAESKSLLIGVPADPQVVRAIILDVKASNGVQAVNGMVSVHLSPDQLLVALSVSFIRDLDTANLETAIAQIETKLHANHPQIIALFVKPQSPERYAEIHGKGAPITCFADVRKIAATPYTSI